MPAILMAVNRALQKSAASSGLSGTGGAIQGLPAKIRWRISRKIAREAATTVCRPAGAKVATGPVGRMRYRPAA